MVFVFTKNAYGIHCYVIISCFACLTNRCICYSRIITITPWLTICENNNYFLAVILLYCV